MAGSAANPPRRVTLKDIAAAAGVGISTVSYALSGKGSVAPETRARIRDLAAQLGYRSRPRGRAGPPERDGVAPAGRTGAAPKPLRRVRGSRRWRVAVLFSGHGPEAIPGGLLAPLEAAVRAAEMELLLVGCPQLQQGGELPEVVEDGQVDGALLYGGLIDHDFAHRLARRVPTVLLGGYLPDEAVDSAWADNVHGLYLAVAHLAELGHRRIAFLNGPPTTFTSTEKGWGFDLACRRLGLPPAERRWREAAAFRLEEGYRLTRELLAEEEPPGAILAGHAALALGALLALKDAGLHVPGDVSLLGYHDDLTLASSVPPVTAVALPLAEVAQAAASLLASRLAGGRQRAIRALIPPQLVVRASTGPPRALSPVSEVASPPAPVPGSLGDGHQVQDPLDSHGELTQRFGQHGRAGEGP